MDKKIWLITGVSTGFGRYLAEEAAKKGDTIIGTVRKPEQLAQIDHLVQGKTFGYLLDVNDHAQVTKVISEVIERFGSIDVLVNNAGYGLLGAVEETSIQEARDQMETNFFGALAVTQAVLPHMRAKKAGHIIQISSQAGFSSTAGLGIYNASKYALEGFSEALALEVAPLGIKVTLVEPGPFRTEWAGASMKYTDKIIEDYASTAGKFKKRLNDLSGKQPGDPLKGVHAIIQVAHEATPPLRLALGKIAVMTMRKKLDSVAKDLNQWEKVSLDTDF